MNTATYRGIARNAAARLEWSKAAVNYQRAIDKYPNPVGALARADIARLRELQAAATAMAKQEGR